MLVTLFCSVLFFSVLILAPAPAPALFFCALPSPRSVLCYTVLCCAMLLSCCIMCVLLVLVLQNAEGKEDFKLCNGIVQFKIAFNLTFVG